MDEKIRWLVAYLHVLGWPALLVLATLISERLVFLRGQPQRRPVLCWYLSIWFIGSDLVSLLTTQTPGQDPNEWPAAPGYSRALYMLLWITLLSIGEALAVQGWAVWKRRTAFLPAPVPSLDGSAPKE